MDDCALKKACGAGLSSLLSMNPFLSELDLSGNHLGGPGIEQLCEGLKHPGCRLQKLEMDGCHLTASCCEPLSAVLQMNPSLSDLDLRVNNLGDSGLRHLCAGLKHPASRIKKLKIKCCSFTESSCADLASFLCTSPFLTELNLGGNDIGDSGLLLLCEGLKHPDCRLQGLWVRHCLLTSSSCADLSSVLSTNQSLTELVLSNNELGNAGLKHLCEGLKHPGCKIQKLWIGYCSLTSSCCTDLASVLSANQCLRDLDISFNELADSGIIQLCAGLKDPRCGVRTLDLTECSLTGLCFGELASALQTNTSLEELRFCQNDLKDTYVKQLLEGVTSKDCKTRVLWIDSCTLTELCCGHLGGALNTTSLSLTELYLGYNVLGDLGAKQLCEGLKQPDCKIQTLWMGTCSLTWSCCADLSTMISTSPALTELDLTGNELGDHGVRLLCDGLKHPGCKLRKLGIASCSLTAACCSDLASALTVNRSLTELNLSWNDLGDCGFRQLCTGLKHPGCRIQTLLVASCSLTGSSCSELASVLSTSQFLTEIQLYHNSLGDSGMIQLCEGLRHPKCKMQTLRLSRCSFTAACCGSLAMALSANSSLTVLDLGENELGCQGLILLSEALKHPGCRVRTLGLTDSFRTDSGSEEVPSALTTSQSSS